MIRVKDRRIWLFRIFAVGAILVLLPVAIRNFHPLHQDYLAYWSVGRLLLSGENPYSPEKMLAMQTAQGWSSDFPVMVWYPPWSLLIFVFIGVFPYTTGWIVWFTISLGIIILCTDLLWRLYGGPLKSRWWARITAILSAPTIFNLVFNQASAILLFGVALFLVLFHQLHLTTSQKAVHPQSPVWHLTLLGVSLVLISIKPQALYLFWLALGVWVLTRRQWKVFITGVAAFLLAAILITLIHPPIWKQYIRLLDEFPPTFWATPSLGFVLRLIVGLDQTWMQFLPVVPGLVWLAWRWKKAGNTWSWQAELPVLIVVSLITAAHTWTYDQILLIPAQMQITARLADGPLPRGAGWLVAGWVILNVASIVLHFWFSDAWFFWQAPVFLGLYAYGLRITSKPIQPIYQNLHGL